MWAHPSRVSNVSLAMHASRIATMIHAGECLVIDLLAWSCARRCTLASYRWVLVCHRGVHTGLAVMLLLGTVVPQLAGLTIVMAWMILLLDGNEQVR